MCFLRSHRSLNLDVQIVQPNDLKSYRTRIAVNTKWLVRARLISQGIEIPTLSAFLNSASESCPPFVGMNEHVSSEAAHVANALTADGTDYGSLLSVRQRVPLEVCCGLGRNLAERVLMALAVFSDR